MERVSAIMEHSLTWDQLNPSQQTNIVLYCDQYEYEAWELIHGRYVVKDNEILFADETMH